MSTASTGGWECPACLRRFARNRQSHECSPAMTVDEYFRTGPAFERPIFDTVLRFVETLGPVHVEPVSVGIFIKREGSWLELRPKTKWIALSFPFPRTIDHPRISRKPIDVGNWVYHVVNLREPADFDATIQGWLTESYDFDR